jgi:hypothetical protein
MVKFFVSFLSRVKLAHASRFFNSNLSTQPLNGTPPPIPAGSHIAVPVPHLEVDSFFAKNLRNHPDLMGYNSGSAVLFNADSRQAISL